MLDKNIGITELVTKIGDCNILFQNLDSAATRMDYNHKKGTIITFGTDQRFSPSGTEMLGIVLWLPRDKVSEVLSP